MLLDVCRALTEPSDHMSYFFLHVHLRPFVTSSNIGYRLSACVFITDDSPVRYAERSLRCLAPAPSFVF
jgi:hypothetical protein